MTNMVMAYFILAGVCACLLMYVMVKYLEQQRANKTDPDPPWLRAARSTSFFAASCLMVFSAVVAEHGAWEISTPVLLLLSAIIMILAFNAISQHRRTPPSDDGSTSKEVYSEHGLALMGYRLVKADITRLDHGQLLMIKMLEDIRNAKQLDPGPATIDPNPVVVHPAQFRPRQ